MQTDNVALFKRRHDVGMTIKHESSKAISIYCRLPSIQVYIIDYLYKYVDLLILLDGLLLIYIHIYR